MFLFLAVEVRDALDDHVIALCRSRREHYVLLFCADDGCDMLPTNGVSAAEVRGTHFIYRSSLVDCLFSLPAIRMRFAVGVPI